ncbi:putative quinol monooxygenase [Flavobacterium sp. 5]|uniref:putative quinol monooxygenase n=1 Tax=Flavobacterium sp. 5 TaxID=2035199 RepID=UPI000CA9A0A6|nr:antibiotic biosynthesis monooxygenase [Flavobacterium sp. 5]PKB15567.1 quinol monooxygenase YgiN [Flavobacterium sp. 5]
MKKSLILLLIFFSIGSINAQDKMIVRLTEIEIDSNFLKEYIEILKEESSASVEIEPGVISIFPMFEKDNPTQIRILEIYVNKEAYESHLKTPHFQKYKSTTLNMVKALRLIDMSVIDPATMKEIFSKLKS